MRFFLFGWALPLGLFWSWYFLSLNDVNFGFTMLTREAHDLVFNIYGHVLGLDPTILPGLVARACIFDTFLILAIWAFRRRREIGAWIRSRRYSEVPSSRNL